MERFWGIKTQQVLAYLTWLVEIMDLDYNNSLIAVAQDPK